MSKGEVTAKLKALDFQSLSKSDRDAINNFYLQNGSVEKIKHLISK
jgi:serine protease inhibitor